MRIVSKRRILFLALLVCVAAGVWFVVSDQSTPGNAEWLSTQPVMRSRLAFLGRWAGPVKRQLSRVKQWSLGPAKTVMVTGSILEFDSASALSTLGDTGPRLTNTSGAQLLVVTSRRPLDELFPPSIRSLSHQRVIVREKLQAQLAVSERVTIGSGTNFRLEWVGFWLDVWPRVNAESIDLTCFLTSSERVAQRTNDDGVVVTNGFFIRTNAAFGARIQIPRNGSVFLISGRTNQNGKVIGVGLSPTVLNAGGK